MPIDQRSSPVTPVLLLLLLAGAFRPAAAEAPSAVAQAADRERTGRPEITAEVDGRPIFRKQVDFLTAARAGEDLAVLDREDIQALRKQVVDDLIDRSLLLEVARGAVPAPTAEDVQQVLTAALNDSKDGQNRLPKEFGQAAENDLRNALRDDLWIRRYFSQIDSSITIPEAEIKLAYQQDQSQFKEPEQFHIRQILLPLPDKQEEQDEVRTQAAALAADIRSDKITFNEAVRLYSTGPARDRGGDLGFVSENQIPAGMIPQLKKQPLGIVGDPIENGAGISLITVTSRRGGKIPAFDQVAADIKTELTRVKRDQTVRTLLEQKRAAAKIIRYFD